MCLEYTGKLGLGTHISHPSSFGRLGQKDYKIKTSSGNLAKRCLEIKSKK